MAARILIVEDDERLGPQVAAHLERAGFAPTLCADGSRAAALDPRDFELLVLDLMLPGVYGLDLLKAFREVSGVPVLILSARDDTSGKVRALKLGADDYMTKPFWPEELVERVRARLRRPRLEASSAPLRAAGIEIDLAGLSVRTAAGPVDLTRGETSILIALMRRPGAAVTRSALVDAALADSGGNERTLDVHVARLRRKLGPPGERILTVWGVGYRLRTEREDR